MIQIAIAMRWLWTHSRKLSTSLTNLKSKERQHTPTSQHNKTCQRRNERRVKCPTEHSVQQLLIPLITSVLSLSNPELVVRRVIRRVVPLQEHLAANKVQRTCSGAQVTNDEVYFVRGSADFLVKLSRETECNLVAVKVYYRSWDNVRSVARFAHLGSARRFSRRRVSDIIDGIQLYRLPILCWNTSFSGCRTYQQGGTII